MRMPSSSVRPVCAANDGCYTWPFNEPLRARIDPGNNIWLTDGFHRLTAWRNVLLPDFPDIDPPVPVIVTPGTVRDAILDAIGANSAHGLRRSNEDKRNAVLRLLEDAEWTQWSDRELARRAGVTHPFVSKLRAEMTGNRYQSDTATNENLTGNGYQSNPYRRGADGRTINTANIGGQPKAAPNYATPAQLRIAISGWLSGHSTSTTTQRQILADLLANQASSAWNAFDLDMPHPHRPNDLVDAARQHLT